MGLDTKQTPRLDPEKFTAFECVSDDQDASARESFEKVRAARGATISNRAELRIDPALIAAAANENQDGTALLGQAVQLREIRWSLEQHLLNSLQSSAGLSERHARFMTNAILSSASEWLNNIVTDGILGLKGGARMVDGSASAEDRIQQRKAFLQEGLADRVAWIQIDIEDHRVVMRTFQPLPYSTFEQDWRAAKDPERIAEMLDNLLTRFRGVGLIEMRMFFKEGTSDPSSGIITISSADLSEYDPEELGYEEE